MTAAKATAMKDITEYCKKHNTINYVYHEREILMFFNIGKPDFRQFNGGNHMVHH